MSKRQEKLDQAARAAWLYYVAGKTQNEIAEQLNVSRQAAQRLVASAVDNGLVKVSVHHRITECLELANALRSKFGLELCEVVPNDHDTKADLQRKLAVAGAQVMEQYLCRETPMVFELGSGRTLKAIIDELSEIDRPQHKIVSLIGAIAHDGAANRYDVVLPASDKTQSKYYQLSAPLFADSADDKQQWCNHRLYRTVAQLAGQANVAFIGIGSIGLGCPLHEDGFLTTEEVEELVELNAVAEILGRPIDQQGELIDSPIQQRVTSLEISRPPSRPVIAFAGGTSKVVAVLAALRGKWINGLVTDEYCARQILELSQSGPA